MAGAKVPLTFRIYKGDQLIREDRLSLSVIKLGKVPSAHLKLDDETVSRMHAIIEVNGPGDVSIIDLGSTKGTFVNGQKVNKAKLQSGDQIVVGETRIELSIGAAEDDEVTKVNAASAPPVDVIASTPKPATPPAPSPFAQTMQAPPPAPAARPAPAVPAAPTAPPSFAPPSFAPPAPAPMAAAPMPPSAPAVRPPPGMSGGAPLFGAVAPPSNFQQAFAESADDLSGARAVEVAAMLGDSVVGVKHCMDPRSGSVTPVTWVLLAVGAACALVFAIAFRAGVKNAEANHKLREYLTTCTLDFDELLPESRSMFVEKKAAELKISQAAVADKFEDKKVVDPKCTPKPGYAVREHFMSPLYDVMAFGGFFLAIGFLGVGLWRARGERRSPMFRIGNASGVEFPTEVPGAMGAFPLVTPAGDDFAFNIAPGMDGEMVVNGQSHSLQELAAQGRSTIAPIPANAKIRARVGQATFLVSAVPRPRRAMASLFASFEARVLAYFGGSLAAHLIFLFIVKQAYIDDSGVNVEMALNADTSARSSNSSQDDPPPPEEEETEDDGADESGGTGTAMALEEGKMGKKDSDRAEGQYKMKNNNADPQLARQQAIEQARHEGILGSASLTAGGAFASLTGTGDISSGFDDADIYGGLLGSEAGEMQGGFGYGRSGFGPGGGGTGWGTIGTGRYGTIGHGSGTGNGYGVGGGRGGGRGHSAAVPPVSIGQPTSSGDLDKAIIRRYIKRNIQKIQYCYEKELLAKSNLSGTVQTSFFISPSGSVTSSSGRGVDPAVAGCVANVIKGIQFPAPKGGGGVQVNYPFTFRPAGS